MPNAKCRMQNATCKNAKCKTLNAHTPLFVLCCVVLSPIQYKEQAKKDAELKAQGLKQTDIDDRKAARENKMQQHLALITKDHMVTYFLRESDRAEAVSMMEYLELRLADGGDTYLSGLDSDDDLSF